MNQSIKFLSYPTRWLARHSCITRVLRYWNTIKDFLQESVLNEKTNIGPHLLSIMQKLDVKAYLLFLKHILNIFNIYNAYFQAKETRIQLLHLKSNQFLTQICENFLKPELLQNLSINFEFSKI